MKLAKHNGNKSQNNEISTTQWKQATPIEKNSICWLGMFWSMAAGLSWFMLVLSWSWADLSWSWAGYKLVMSVTSCFFN